MNLRHFILGTCALLATTASARETYNFNSDWKIGKKSVTLPHAWNEDEAFKVEIKQMSDSIITYTKTFTLPESAKGKRVFIEFEGARQMAEVFINDKVVGLHENGVTAFGFDITSFLKEGKNFIKVVTDNDWRYHERSTGSTYQWQNNNFNANYGGLPKNVWLHVMGDVYQTLPLWSNLKTTGQYIYGKDYDIQNRQATICVETQVKNETAEAVKRNMQVEVKDLDGKVVCSFASQEVEIPAGGMATLKAECRAYDLHFWSWGYGYLYDVTTTVGDDVVNTKTGFRKTAFKNGMFYLNDRVLMVRGYAQRTSNEWPGVGMSVPAWLSDYSNDLQVKSGGNTVRWMHVAPWKQDVESCDRVGLIQAMPAGDAEKDVEGRRWEHREEAMRDAIIYFRNNPSIIFYEGGNESISREHMIALRNIRDQYDPHGGRASGCREMLDIEEAEYGGEMLYINKSQTKPMWMMEYCRDEGLRWYWNSWSYPYHKEGDGPLYRNAPATSWNHNSDELAVEHVRRWHEYWQERPGSGTRVNSGGVKIIFSDTQTHGRSADNYRVSGNVDPMRVPKDAFFAHQVMWDGWVDDLTPRTYICGHWDYEKDFVVPTIYVVSTSEKVVLMQNGKTIAPDSHDYRFLSTFKNVKVTGDKLIAIGYDAEGHEESRYEIEKPGAPDHIKLTAIENPTGWKADGADVALIQVEIVDKQGRRCPLDNRLIKWSVKGPAEWRGGVAKGKDNHVLCDTLPVESGINRVMLRSLTKAGQITVTAKAEGMADAKITLNTTAIETVGGLSKYIQADVLKPRLDKGETPSVPSFKQWRRGVQIVSAECGKSKDDIKATWDDNELSTWESSNNAGEGWVTYTLAEKTKIDEICVKVKNFRATTYPIRVYAEDQLIWEGWTPKSLGYAHLKIKDMPATNKITIKMAGESTSKDAFGEMKELDSRNNEKLAKGRYSLKITEIEFLKNL